MAGVVREAEQIGITNMDKRVNTGNGKDEIALLAITFNRMLERIQRVFEGQRYFVSNASHALLRAENAAGIRGHGIGLSLTRRIIEQHRGKLMINSLPQQGTTFTVWLPLAS